MAIYLPCIRDMLRPETEEWYGSRTDARLWGLDPDDNTAYWQMLEEVWRTDTDDIVIVEHDMVPAEGVIDEMLDCEEPWCVSPYRLRHSSAFESLGCTKFSHALHKIHSPDLMHVVGEIEDGLPAKDWRRLDVRIAGVLRSRGLAAHLHRKSHHLHYEVQGEAT